MRQQEIVDHIEEIYRELSRVAGDIEREEARRRRMYTWAEQRFRRLNERLQMLGRATKKLGRKLGVAVYLSKPVKRYGTKK